MHAHFKKCVFLFLFNCRFYTDEYLKHQPSIEQKHLFIFFFGRGGGIHHNWQYVIRYVLKLKVQIRALGFSKVIIHTLQYLYFLIMFKHFVFKFSQYLQY